jgi:hypothetical protein
LCNPGPEFYVLAVIVDDFPSPRAIVARILGVATVGAAVALVALFLFTGEVAWSVVALIGILWAAWGFLGGLFGSVIEPAGRFLADQLTGNVSLPGPSETLEQQTARFERMLAQTPPLAPHHEILIGIRLAEIYRTHQRDPAKSDALLARLRAKFPGAPELERGGPG